MKRILIADDDEAARAGLAELLSAWGYEVEEAIDGKDALERAPAFDPAVVIADLVMLGLDGLALLNCSAIPKTLMESELFGHEKGAFACAHERKAGYFELADAGTIFLDEITEMSSALQVKYPRILQDGVVRRLGAKTELKVDVRIVAATNRDAAQAVRDKAFREEPLLPDQCARNLSVAASTPS